MNAQASTARTRREFLIASAAAATMAHMTGCAAHATESYDEMVARQRAVLATNPDLLTMLRFATLAPSGHNTQPWRFAVHANGTVLTPDLSRRTPIVDPDDHHLFVSLGCAAENFLLAAQANGRPGDLAFDINPDRIEVDLAHGPSKTNALYEAIPHRQSTRSNYEGRPVPSEAIRSLEMAAKLPGVSVLLLTKAKKRDDVLGYVLRGNSEQMDSPAFVDELKQWVRFNSSQALATGDGLFSKCSGQRTIPTWIGKRMFASVFQKNAENAKYAAQLRSSAGVAVFIGDKADKEHWINVGRSFQRFALQATALGIRYAMVNQPIEVPSVRADFASWLGMSGSRPDLVLRFGYAPPMPMSLRRPVSNVLAAQA